MTILLPILAVAFAAFCIWLTVRIVNRRERWAKWTLAAVIGAPVLYVASFGPACWLCQQLILPQRAAWIIFQPLTWLCVHGQSPMKEVVRSYLIVCGDNQHVYYVIIGPSPRRAPNSHSLSPVVYEIIIAEDSRWK